jgi:hypothetical protein
LFGAALEDLDEVKMPSGVGALPCKSTNSGSKTSIRCNMHIKLVLMKIALYQKAKSTNLDSIWTIRTARLDSKTEGVFHKLFDEWN